MDQKFYETCIVRTGDKTIIIQGRSCQSKALNAYWTVTLSGALLPNFGLKITRSIDQRFINEPVVDCRLEMENLGNFRFRPLTREDDASNGSVVNETTFMDSGHNVDFDHESSTKENASFDAHGGVHESTSKADIIRRLLRPVKEKHSSKEAEEIRVTQLYNHALHLSSESETAFGAIPLLESIVHSFLFRSSSNAPPHLKTINFASCRLLATLYLKSDKPETAFKLLKTAVELDPTDLGVWVKLATTSITLNKFEDADKALYHILKEQPSHPVALYWAPVFYFGVCELFVCLMYAQRCLFINPRDQIAVYLVKCVLEIEPSCDYLLDELFKSYPNILDEVEVSEAVKKHTDERVSKIRTAYRQMIDEQNKANILKTFKFPGPLYKITWEHLANAIVNMFDKLMKEDLVETGLDLGSLFEEGEIPPKEPQMSERSPTPTFPASQDESLATSVVAVDPTLAEGDTLSLDANVEAVFSSIATSQNEEEELRRISRRLRRPIIAFDESPVHSMTTTPLHSSGGPAGTPTSISLPTAATSKPLTAGAATAAAAESQRIRCLWMNKALQFHRLLPPCFKELAAIAHKKILPNNHSQKYSSQSNNVSFEATAEDEEATTAAIESGPSEADLVTDFLRILSREPTNVILIGIALLLQMTARVKTWTQSYSTAYLALSARIRPTLPVWDDNYIPEVEYTSPPVEDQLLPTDLLRLRRRPTMWQIANLHFSYVESRLDALALCRKAADSAKRQSASVNVSCSGIEDGDLKALSEALQADSKQFWDPEETISIPDERKMLRALWLLPEESPETIIFQGRLLWINYEWSAVTHKYDAMKDYLLQAKEFVIKYGPLRRLCSFRNNYITLERIDELLVEVEDISIGIRLEHLCKSQQDTTKLIKALKDCIHSHSTALQKRSESSMLLTPFARLESLPRICHMFLLPLRTLNRHLIELYNNYSSDEEVEVVSKSALGEVINLAIRSWRVALRVLDLVVTIIGDWTNENGYSTLLSKEEVADVLEAWKTVMIAHDLLCNSWEVINSEMEYGSIVKAINKKLTLESLCTKVLFTFKPYVGEDEEAKPTMMHNLGFGEVCQALCLIVNTFAWRLHVTGSLLLPPPKITSKFAYFLFEAFHTLEGCFPICLLHSELGIYRALYDLGDVDTERDTVKALVSYLKTQRLSHIIGIARGRGHTPPSRYSLHLFHDLIPLINIRTRCTAENANPLGLPYLRNIGITIAQTLHNLSEGFYHFREIDPSFCNSSSRNPNSPSTSIPRTNRNDSKNSWPHRVNRLGDALAQVIHCLCGISNRSGVAPVSDNPDTLSLSCDSYGKSPLEGTRFMQKARPPDRRQMYGSEVDNEVDEDRVFLSLQFKPFKPDLPKMPPSCVAPRPPLWIEDAASFYEIVESHQAIACDLTNPSSSGNTNGCWWLGAKPSDKDWQLIEIAFVFYCPPKIPEFDAIKSLTVSEKVDATFQMANWLIEASKMMPKTYEEFMTSEDRIEECLTLDQPLPVQNHYLSDMINLMYYLVADYHMKTFNYTNYGNFKIATDYYKKDLRVAPHHTDSWASLALIYGSEIEQIMNFTDPKTERVHPKFVSSCFRCFELALELTPRLNVILTERGNVAYQLHSYSARIVKKKPQLQSQERCRRKMLNIAHRSYGQALCLDRRYCAKPFPAKPVPPTTPQTPSTPLGPSQQPTESPESSSSVVIVSVEGVPESVSPSPSQPSEPSTPVKPEDNKKPSPSETRIEEEWLLHYMLTKCEEKAGPGGLFRDWALTGRRIKRDESRGDWVLRVVACYIRTAEILHTSGAKYPKRINYNKIPLYAVESIELYYRTHAFLMKQLIAVGEPQPSSPLPLRQVCEILHGLTQSPFITEPAKASAKTRGRKRPGNFPEPTSKIPRIEGTNNPVPIIDVDNLDVTVEVANTTPEQQHTEPLVESTASPDFSSFSDLELWKRAIEYCKKAMEIVLQRLPLHYKAMYRLAHLFYTVPAMRDLDKAMAILMGPFDHVTKVEFGGLFKDRKQSNFFHGVWRIPTCDIDRSGSFAAHMYRSTYMVLEILNSRGDWTRMLQVFHQLRKQPSEDKRGFLSEGDRVFLARRAFSLIHPSLRLWLTNQRERALEGTATDVTIETLKQIYRLHSRPVASAPAYSEGGPPSSSTSVHSSALGLPATSKIGDEQTPPYFADLLVDAYKLCPAAWDAAGPNISVDLILKRCSEFSSGTSSLFLSKSTAIPSPGIQAPP
ncbi:hypothetical protein Aperf_G00000063210 [Anoplocephala perfoliata]